MISDKVSLYVHIPFCQHRCAYCDFNTYTGLGDLQSAYAAAVAAEVAQTGRAGALHARAPLSVHTVFFGGGTPSLMAPPDLARILQSVRDSFVLDPVAELTMEANPGTVDAAYLDEVRALGINRLSFGMQSAIGSELALLERTHDYAAVREAVALSRAAGFENVSLDLIYGLPGQTLASWQQSLEAALALEPEHLSLYCLTIEPGTPMQRWLDDGRIEAPDPDLAAAQYELACARLAQAGWEHYEISNWAQPGYACRHNLTYWRNDSYLGLGAGAHGHAAGYRYQIVKQPRTYLRRMASGTPGDYPLSAAVAAAHRLDEAEAMADTVITQLRLLYEGLDMAAFAQRFGRSLREAYGETVEQLVDWGLVREEGEKLLLTERGWFLSNQVFYRFL
ncbi:MAG: radical SAM family heme chaperone HemW [Anaerolineae bacterium]|nr:radical SAM family heme chaperone HemW [Anaerolineae bacterium]